MFDDPCLAFWDMGFFFLITKSGTPLVFSVVCSAIQKLLVTDANPKKSLKSPSIALSGDIFVRLYRSTLSE